MRTDPEIEPTDIHQLDSEIGLGNYQDALPSRLSQDWLMRIVRDLRKMQEADPSEAENWSYASGPIYLVGLILVGLSTAKGLTTSSQIPIEVLMEALGKYHQLAEREIVNRQLGFTNELAESEFIQYVDQLVDSDIA